MERDHRMIKESIASSVGTLLIMIGMGKHVGITADRSESPVSCRMLLGCYDSETHMPIHPLFGKVRCTALLVLLVSTFRSRLMSAKIASLSSSVH